jgi:hypothetical protein
MNIQAIGNISEATLRNHIEMEDNTEFSFELPMYELNERMRSRIEKKLIANGRSVLDINAVIFCVMMNFNTSKMRFEMIVYFPDDRGDEWGNSFDIPVHFTNSEFEQIKLNCLTRFITNMVQA